MKSLNPLKNLSTYTLLVLIVGFFINIESANSRVDILIDKFFYYFIA
jgi:hypothetical protein